MKLVSPFSAIDSWEGYKYQGHIALYVTLTEIEKLINSSLSCDDYELQIEGFEDFSILLKGAYKTIHQVKQKKVDLGTNDLFEFVVGIVQNNADLGYYHINTTETIPNNILLETKNYILNLLNNDLQQTVCSKKELAASDNIKTKKKECIIIEYVSQYAEKGSKYTILNCESDGKKDKTSITAAVSAAKSDLNKCLDIINKKISAYAIKSPGKPEDNCLLMEWGEKFDNVIAVRKRGAQIIQSILKTTQPTWTFADKRYCEFVYDQLTLKLEKYVTDHFIEKNINNKCLIPFTVFYNGINYNWPNHLESTEYKYFLMRKKIEDCFYAYVRKNCKANDCTTCGTSSGCNLVNQMKILRAKDFKEMNHFIDNLIFNINVDITNLPNDDKVRRQLMDMIKEITRFAINDHSVVSADFKSKYYWLTLDESSYKDTLLENIIKYIAEPTNKALIYEYDTLITSNLENDDLTIDESKETVLGKEQIDELSSFVSTTSHDENNNITKPKVLNLIKADTARGELTP